MSKQSSISGGGGDDTLKQRKAGIGASYKIRQQAVIDEEILEDFKSVTEPFESDRTAEEEKDSIQTSVIASETGESPVVNVQTVKAKQDKRTSKVVFGEINRKSEEMKLSQLLFDVAKADGFTKAYEEQTLLNPNKLLDQKLDKLDPPAGLNGEDHRPHIKTNESSPRVEK